MASMATPMSAFSTLAHIRSASDSVPFKRAITPEISRMRTKRKSWNGPSMKARHVRRMPESIALTTFSTGLKTALSGDPMWA